MSITVALRHRTSYRYPEPASLSPQVIRLRPAPHTRIPIVSYSLDIEPAEHWLNWQQDPFGNYLARVVVPEPTTRFTVEVHLVAELVTVNPFDFFLEPEAEHIPFGYDKSLAADLAPYLSPAETWSGDLDRWFESATAGWRTADTDGDGVDGLRTVDFLIGLTRRMAGEIAYEIRYEPGVQSSATTLQRAAGSCRDSAWFLVEALRRLGLAARFVSGYLVQLAPDVRPLDGPAGPTEDFTDLHAWAEVYLPGAGWIGLDPTSGLAAGEGHIPLVATPAPQSAAPISGAVSVATEHFAYTNVVTRMAEAPRSTKPYTEQAWSAITKLGRRVDEALTESDVRLTMGGEPTFVSSTDFEAPEWTIEADGDDKRDRATLLTARLRDRLGPGGLVQHGQGKWYPGEPLPRWEMNLVWRPDGVPVWSDPNLLAGSDDDLGHDHRTARQLAEAIAVRLGVPTDYVRDAYEDPVYGLWEEASLPADLDLDLTLDPVTVNLDDPDERRTLAAMLDRNLGTPAGSFLPLDRAFTAWRTSSWPVRRSQVFLTPGTSAMGMRLPLDGLPSKLLAEPPAERDPLAERPPLSDNHPTSDGTGDGEDGESASTDASTGAAVIVVDPKIIRTALAVEARGGVVRVFLPPLAELEDGLALVAAVEAAAMACGTPVVVEGYPLPSDHRVKRLSVTPDPGVIEVNVQPTSTFDELLSLTDGLYDDARQVGLATEKFDVDGRQTGTGGGNHITIGGPTPADSPLLRNPSLLASIVTYWQHHPSLSYLFSGMFVGPTSQAPRVDEARHENLYEIEIALAELARAARDSGAGAADKADIDSGDPDHGDEAGTESGGGASPWLVDRALRHLLSDLTGNTHRAELCIDKLYSPDHARGRLGLLEMRAFEMPPHPRMAMVQFLLVRAIVAWLWTEPYRHRLVRWGTDLHDRFLLPHYLADDARSVVDDLARAGFGFQPEWLEPFFEFRFPRYGTVVTGGVSLELRAAIEPWLVLGEETAETGTFRYVDSSLERLQVKTTGLVAGRHEVTVNGRRLPLRPTGRAGEHVAGVRYRAWHPPSALHPTIGVHHPLSFAIVDTWSDQVIGGARYHVSHPGGLAYETFPVNALEAEARRQSRFEVWTAGAQSPSTDDRGPEHEHERAGTETEAEPAGTAAMALAPSEPLVGSDAPPAISDQSTDPDFPVTLDLRRSNPTGLA